ncbi:hypothetical protein RZA67_08140 [Stenotrophomonas sp. C3(2023)]|uniref:hypothetical protein n=1 Tax=Stenotrophomonas sp. C3(2023) TaxID=3080277 RepID=UPI00293C65D1|nr:hypothetical protein [Stenotrophomonas sp. C3(2023)]MDV3468693.1 hypothetical protein [Stenotrophomonas sp. C3(2023)]
MSLRNILNTLRGLRRSTLDQAMTVEARPSSLIHKDFREFTAPARSQRGGAIRLTGRTPDRLARIGIIPSAGVNIP